MNYKSGDLVTITGNSNGHWFKAGEIVRLKRNCGGELHVWTAEYLDGSDFWYVRESDMKPFKPAIMPQKIVITTDGKTTTARLFDGKKLVKRAEAKCAPSDTFDFAVGAELAVKRLMGANPATEPPTDSKPEPVKLYCVKDNRYHLSKGKIYLFCTDRAFKYDDCSASRKYASLELFFESYPFWKDCLFPLVRRPAKVGEWVLVSDNIGSTYKSGEIYKVFKTGTDDCVWFANDYKGNIRRGNYLVLDGYKGESE